MKKKSCKTCGWKLESGRELPIFHKDNEEDVRLANEYCKEHTFIYGHKCEPIWCEKCGHLDMYLATVSENSKEPKFDKRK